ncbi:MAG: EamA family transporter [Candidatus Methanoperedens sp.]|nr:EamA family transporter [Candidatus Methanoperedens sp.]
MTWIIYAVACIFLYGIMQFFIKLSSNGNAITSSMFFVTAQFITQLVLGAYFISKSGFDMNVSSIKYSILGGIAAAIATILFFLALEQESISKVVPVVNLNVVVGVLLGIIILKDELNLRITAGFVLAIISIYLLTTAK